MDISQDINYQKANIDLPHLNQPKQVVENKANVPKSPVADEPSQAKPGAASVSLSEQGRAASLNIDFGSETDILSKMQALGNTGNFGKAHAAISYDNVKHLLED